MAKTNKTELKKKRIFDLFSQNLTWLLELSDLKQLQECKGGFLCPICTMVFYEPQLTVSKENHLTMEHIPPQAVGGKIKTLVCRTCNSTSGMFLDAHLNKMFDQEDFVKRTPNSEFYAKLQYKGDTITSRIRMTKERGMVFDLDTKNTNPKALENFGNHLQSAIHEKKFQIQLAGNPKERSAHISLLRVAYLQLFSTFGNITLFIPGLQKVRDQIRNPEEDILPNTFWLKYNFSAEDYGVNIITDPPELRSFLIIFDLIKKDSRKQCAIVLPGVTGPRSDIYQNINDILCTDGPGAKIKFTRIPDDNYLHNKQDTFALTEYWKEIIKDAEI